MAGFIRRTNMTNEEAWFEFRKHIMELDKLVQQLNPKSDETLVEMYIAKQKFVEAYDNAFPVVNN